MIEDWRILTKTRVIVRPSQILKCVNMSLHVLNFRSLRREISVSVLNFRLLKFDTFSLTLELQVSKMGKLF